MIDKILKLLDILSELINGNNVLRKIKIGDVYKVDNDPFKDTNVKVVSIENGYVQYKFINTESKLSLNMLDFKSIYSIKVKDSND